MAWETVESNGYTYNVNWSVVKQFVRSYNYSKAMLAYSQKVVDPPPHDLIGKVGYLIHCLPRTQTWEVDWDGVHNAVHDETNNIMQWMKSRKNMKDNITTLTSMLIDTQKNQKEYLQRLKTASKHNMQEISKAISNGKKGLEDATAIGHAADTTLTIAAEFQPEFKPLQTIVHTSLQVSTTYAETGNLKRAAASGAYDLITTTVLGKIEGAIPLGDKRIGYKILLAHAKGIVSVPGALIEGKSLHEALISGMIKIGMSAPEALLGSKSEHLGSEFVKMLLKKNGKLSRIAIPALTKLTIKRGQTVTRKAVKHMEDRFSKAAEKLPGMGIDWAADAISKRLTDSEKEPPKHPAQGFLDAAVYPIALIEASAIRPQFSQTW